MGPNQVAEWDSGRLGPSEFWGIRKFELRWGFDQVGFVR